MSSIVEFIYIVLTLGIFGGTAFGVATFARKRVFYFVASILFLAAGVIWLWKTRVLFETVLYGVAAIWSFIKWKAPDQTKRT